MTPTLKFPFLSFCILSGLLLTATQFGLAQNAAAVPNALTFENNFFVTGDYAVGGVSLVGQANKTYPGYAVGTISIGADTNPGVKGTNNSVPAGAEIVAALVYWQTIELIGGATGQNGFFRPVFNGGPTKGYVMQGTPVPNPNGTVYWDGSGCTTGSSSPKQLVTYVAVVTPYLRQDANGNVLAGNNASPQNYEVRLPSQSNGSPLTLGATLVLIYRVMSADFPLNSIVVLDGTYSPGSNSLTTTNTIQGFYQSDGSKSKLTYITGNGQKNQSETVTLNGSSALPSFYGAGQPPFPGWYSGGEWDNVTWTFPNASVTPNNPVPAGSSSAALSWPSQSVSTVVTSGKGNCVTPAAIIFSTRVSDPDHDGLPPVLKNSRGYCDPAINNGSCSFGMATDPGYVPLDDPNDHPQVGRKDVFVQLDYMVDASNNPLLTYSPANDLTTPLEPIASSGGDVNLGVTRLQNALLGWAENFGGNDTHNVHLHVFAGNALQNYSGAITQQPCTDFVTVAGLCSFPSPPADAGGYVGWKGNFSGIKNQLVLNGDPAACTTTPAPTACQPRFQHGRKDSYRYVMLGHAPGLAQWFIGGGTLQSVQQSGNVVTFTTSTSHGPLDAIGIVYPTSGGGLTTIDPATGLPTGITPPTDPSCPNGRVTITGAATNPNLNGTYCIQNFTDTTFTINIGGSAASTAYTLSTDPNLAAAPGYVTTISGVSDEGGEDSLITLASWGPRATEKVIGSTIMHETGHSNALTHGGFTFPNAASGDYTPTVETNCKPDFQSVMSYSRQFDLLQYQTGLLFGLIPSLIDVVDYSEQSLNNLVETTPGVANVFTSTPFYFNTTWYRPTNEVGGTPSILHCDGTPITDGAQYSLLIGPAAICPFCNPALSWLAGEDINFDGQYAETLTGYRDWDHINFDQVGATSSLSSTGGGLVARGGGLIARGGGLVAQGGGLDSLGGGLVARGGGLVARGGGLVARGGGLIARGSTEPSLSTGDSAVHPPTQLFAKEDASPRHITLTWSKPTGITVIDRYNIYRTPAFASGSPLTVPVGSLNFNPATNQYTYVDTTATCVPSYTYAVSALQAGTTNESTKSNTVSTTTAGALLTGCYTNSAPVLPPNSSTPTPITLTNLTIAPASATQGDPVTITWSLRDDDTGTYVTNLAANTLVANGPTSNNSCSTVTPGSTNLILNGTPQTVNGSPAGTFTQIGNQFTFTLDTDVLCSGSYTFTLKLDSSQKETASSGLQLSIDINDADAPHVITPALSAGVVGQAYPTTTLTEDGGTAPFTWTVTGLPSSPAPGIRQQPPGSANLSGTTCVAGTYAVNASVTDAKSNTGTQAFTLQINKANTTTGVVSSSNPSVFQQPVTFTVTVTPQGSCGPPTGTVTLLDGGVPIASKWLSLLSGGMATFMTSALWVGNHNITASYSGDLNFNSSNGALSPAPTQVVNKASTAISVSSVLPSTAFVNQPITVSYTFGVVAPGAGSPIAPSGNISVAASDGSSCVAAPSLVGGICTLSPAPTAAGNVTLTISYSGDGNFVASGANGNYTVYQLVFTAQPTNRGAGLTITPAVVVTAEDSANVPLASFSGAITLAIGTGPGTLAGTTTQNAVNGVATFGDLSINKIANAYTLTASPAGGLPAATSSAFNIDTFYVDGQGNFGTLDLASGTLTQIGAATLPSSTGIDLTPGLQIYAYNGSNQLLQITPSTGAATLIGNGSITNQTTTGALTNGSYFGIDAVTGNVYSIDLGTGATTQVGHSSTGVAVPSGCSLETSLSGSANTLYYTVGYSGASCSAPMPDTLSQIDPTSGATTLIGPITVSGSPMNGFVGSVFVGGTFYGFTSAGQGQAQEYSINLANGAATFLNNTTASIVAAGSSQ